MCFKDDQSDTLQIISYMKKYLFLLLLIASITSNATHLLSGHIAVQDLGITGGIHQYKVTVNIFRDCQAGQVELDSVIHIGDFQTSNNALLKMIDIPIAMVKPINLFGSFCFQIGWYEAIIEENADFYLSYSRCCRTGSIVNAGNDLGTSIYTEVRSGNYQAVIPVPFMNQPLMAKEGVPANFNISGGDSVTDSTTYELSTPILGGDRVDPMPNPIPKPYQAVPYPSGYNASIPFGAGNTVAIGRNSGILSVSINTLGGYIIGITVTKYKNGIAIFKQVRELTIFSCMSCAPSLVQAEEKKHPIFMVYPNPAGKILNLQLPYKTGEPSYFEISDAACRIIISGIHIEAQINIETLHPGVYTIRTASGLQSFTSRFCKL
jgi:hypothetical protein